MQINGIAAKRKRKFMVTTDSRHSLPVAENKLNQEFTASRPNEKWITDITARAAPLHLDKGRMTVGRCRFT
jgi:putative transposase